MQLGHVAYWHFSDIPRQFDDVCFWESNGLPI